MRESKEELAALTKLVTDEEVEQVEYIVGMGHAAWDMVEPKELIAAARLANPLPFILSQLPEAQWEEKNHHGNIRYVWATDFGAYIVAFYDPAQEWQWKLQNPFSTHWQSWSPCPSLLAGQQACVNDFKERVAKLFVSTKGE